MRKKGALSFATAWVDLEGAVLSDRQQRMLYDNIRMCGVKSRTHKNRDGVAVPRARGMGEMGRRHLRVRTYNLKMAKSWRAQHTDHSRPHCTVNFGVAQRLSCCGWGGGAGLKCSHHENRVIIMRRDGQSRDVVEVSASTAVAIMLPYRNESNQYTVHLKLTRSYMQITLIQINT